MRFLRYFLKGIYVLFRIHLEDRFGPDLVLTHWMLYFKPTRDLLVRCKIRNVGEGAECRPFVTVSGGKNISIGRNVVVRPFSSLRAGDINGRIVIEDDVLLGPNVFLSVNIHRYNRVDMPIRSQGYEEPGDVIVRGGSWIGEGAIVLPGVTIGRNSVVGARSVVINDVPDWTVVAGNPARIIKRMVPNTFDGIDGVDR